MITPTLLPAFAVACVLGWGCGETPVDPLRRVVAVLTSRDSAYVEIGDSIELRAEARDVNGNPVLEASIDWQSLDPGVATVAPGTGSARVLAVSAGVAGIVARSGTHADTAAILVLSPITATTLSLHADTAWALGEGFVLGVRSQTTTGARLGHYTVASRSSAVIAWFDDEVDSVRATAQVPGQAYVVIRERRGTADSALLVVHQRPAHVRITPDSLVGFLGRSFQLTASVQDARNNAIPGARVTWLAFDPALASVDTSGLVAFRALGTAHVAAKHASDVADTAPVTTLPMPKLSLNNLVPGHSHDSLQVGAHQLSDAFYAYAENALSPWVHLRLADTSIGTAPDSVIYVGSGGTFTVHGRRPGRTLLIGEATLMAPDTVRVHVLPSRLLLDHPLEPAPIAIKGIDNIRFGVTTADSLGTPHPVADTLVVSFHSSDSAVVDLFQNRSPSVMLPGSPGVSVSSAHAVDTGRAIIWATAPGYAPDSMVWRVVPGPKLSFLQGRREMLGARQTVTGPRQLATISPAQPGDSIVVTLTQRHPATATVPARLTLNGFTGSGLIADYSVEAGLPGTDTVIASAAGHEPDTAVITVTTPHFLLPDTVRGTTLGGFADVFVADSLGTQHATTESLLVLATSSDTAVALATSTRIPARWSAIWSLHFPSVDTGATTMTVRDSAGMYAPKLLTYHVALDSSLHVALDDGYQFGSAATQQRFEDSRFLLLYPLLPAPGRAVHLSTTVPGVLRIPDSVVVAGSGYAYFPGAGGDNPGTTRIVATARGFRPDTSAPVSVGRGGLNLQAPATAFVGGAGYAAVVRTLSPNRIDLPMDQSLTAMLVPIDPGVAPQSATVTVPAGQAVSPAAGLSFTAPGALRLAVVDQRPVPAPFFGDTIVIDSRLPPLRLTAPYDYGALTVGVGQRLATAISRPGEVKAAAVTVDVAHRGSRSTSAPFVVVPAGATFSKYSIDGRAIGADTVTLSAPGYAGDTVAVFVTEGRVRLANFPASLRTGDSLPVQLEVGDSALVGHAVVDRTTFLIETDGGVDVTDGTRSIRELTVPAGAGMVGPVYIKGTAAGVARVTLTNLYYAPGLFTTNVF